MKRYLVILTLCLATATTAWAATANKEHPKAVDWPFDGVFGNLDRQAAQRGFQVYQEVCASCHSLNYVSYRHLRQLGFSEDEVKAVASQVSVTDGPNEEGEMFERPGRPSDRFAAPFANEQAARAANNGAHPPDLSLMVKARPNGANYVFSLLTGYENAPSDFPVRDGMYYNPYFEGKQIGMPPPLMDDGVEYMDGTEATVEQMAKDVTIFLQWTAEPEMEDRKQMGIKVLLFMLIFTVLFYIAKCRIWSRLGSEN